MYIGFLLAIVFLFLPGCVLVQALNIKVQLPLAIIMAPVVSAAYYGLLGTAYTIAGIQSSPATLLAPIAILLAVELVLYLKDGNRRAFIKKDEAAAIVLYAAVGVLIGWYVFVRSLTSHSGMVEQYDVVFHANLIRKFIETGNFSCIGVNVGTLDASFYGSSATGFYPAAWHEVVALVVISTGIPLTMAMNAVNWVYCSVVFPAGMLGLFKVVFKDDRQKILIGSIAPLAFTAFPWRDLLWGPIFPNTASFCCMPAVTVAFMLFFSSDGIAIGKGKLLAAGVVGIAGLGMLQPNAVFAAAIFVVFYIMHIMNSPENANGLAMHSRGKNHAARNRRLLSLLLFVACIVVWTLLYRSSFMHGVVSYSDWTAYTTAVQAFVNILTQSYMMGMGYYTFPQLCLAAVVLLGFATALLRRETRWLAAPYSFFCIAFIINVSTDGFLKRYLTGFWYSDPNRIAAICAIMAMPFAVIGLSLLYMWVRAIIARYSDVPEKLHGALPALCVTAVFLLMNYYPNYINPSDGAAVTTAFGEIRSQYEIAYQKLSPYTESEEAFARQCLEILPEDALVINNPGDGSVIAYGFDGLHVMYDEVETGVNASAAADSSESQIIRSSLVDIANNSAVKEAVADTGAKYIILLSRDDGDTSATNKFVADEWAGISSINDETPGFKLLLSDGQMRLYEIEE